MPSLSGIVNHFSQKFHKSNGTIIRGYYRPPQNVRASFDGMFTPRAMLACAPTQNINPGDCIRDSIGNYLLLGVWASSTYIGSLVATQFVVFDAPEILLWQRCDTVVEPISGLSSVQPPRNLGLLRGLKEPIAKAKDGMGIVQNTYRIMVGVPVRLDDLLDGMRVQRVENVIGLTYAEVVGA